TTAARGRSNPRCERNAATSVSSERMKEPLSVDNERSSPPASAVINTSVSTSLLVAASSGENQSPEGRT
ncbi:hypothetical protein KI387_000781, partial [Taxus chinensis]